MDKFSASHINNLVGNSGKEYSADMFVSFPFPDDLNESNCLCFYFATVKTQKYNDNIVFKIEYHESLQKSSLLQNPDINGFSCNGILIIKTDEQNAGHIKLDIQSNSSIFKKHFSECL